jgi:DNA primase
MGSGKPIYFSCRNLAWEKKALRAVTDNDKAPRMWNPQQKLVGDRQLYLNFMFSRTARECLILEGQGDGVSLAQWRHAAIALNGLALGGQNAEANKKRFQWLIEKIGTVYIGLDNDERGKLAVESVAGLTGGMARIVTWKNNVLECTHD